MIVYLLYFSAIFLLFLLSSIFIKKSFLLSYTGDKHQKYINQESVPLIGGIILILGLSIIFFSKSLILLVFFIMIFSLGLISDLKIIRSANLRMILQLIIIIMSVYFLNIKLMNTRILILDEMLNIYIFNIFFVTFCILILVNGSNFIDGLNGLNVGYYIILIVTILNLKELTVLNTFSEFEIILPVFIILFVGNILNKSFLGDNGSYLVGYFFSYFLINFYLNNQSISPFFIILLVWYPSFELLFSIIRKFNFNKSPIKPDNNHLHHLVFYFFRKKITNVLICNNLSSFLINLYNLSIITIGSKNVFNSQIQILLVIFSVIFYSAVYIKLYNYKFSKE